MKNSLPYLLPLVCFAVAFPAVNAAAEEKSDTKTEKKELRVITGPERRTIVRHIGDGEKELVTFLGVETSPVSPALTAQLGLQDGAGLVVNRVAPDSPAAGALKVHDVLLKLDDQILIEQRQLAVLVRGHKEGDEVNLTYLRGGKQATAKVKLGKRELPKLSLELNQPGENFMPFNVGPNGEAFDFRSFGPMGPPDGAGPEHVLGLINGGLRAPGMQRMNIARADGPGERNISVIVNTGNSHVNLDDDQGTLELTITDGKKQLLAKNTKGDQVFSGPINTPEERKALPDEVRGRLEKLEDSTEFSFKTGSDFKSETKVARPRGQGISVPAPLLGRASSTQSF